MTQRESFAINYLIFRDPTEYILIIFPFSIALMVDLFTSRFENIKKFQIGLVADKFHESIDTYLLYYEYAIIVLLAFFFCYRWSSIQNDGSYGFWLTLGIDRKKFFIRTEIKFLLILYFSLFIGLISIFYLNQYNIDIIEFIQLNLLIISHLFIIIGIAVLLGNLIKNPEIAAIIFMGLMIFNATLNNTRSSIWFKLFHSDFLYYGQNVWNVWLSLIISGSFGILINYAAYRIHVKYDVEM